MFRELTMLWTQTQMSFCVHSHEVISGNSEVFCSRVKSTTYSCCTATKGTIYGWIAKLRTQATILDQWKIQPKTWEDGRRVIFPEKTEKDATRSPVEDLSKRARHLGLKSHHCILCSLKSWKSIPSTSRCTIFGPARHPEKDRDVSVVYD